MVVVTLLVLWPTVLVLSALLAPVPGLHTLPWFLEPLPLLVLMVPLLEFLLMPIANRIFAPFLRGRPQGR